MTSTYVNDLRLNEMATGDQSGSWGTVTNTNLELIAEAFAFGTEAITTNADTHETLIADGATDPGRSMFLKYTGTLDSACTITISAGSSSTDFTISKLWFIENATTGGENIIITSGSGANVTIPAGDVKVIYTDGAGAGGAVVDAFASLSVVDLKVQDDLTVTDDLIVGGDIDLEGSIDVNGTANLDAVDIDGAVQLDSTLTVGVDDTGYDVKFFGDTASAYMLWDASADDLILGGAAGLSVNSTALVTGVLTTTAATVSNGGGQFNGTVTVGVDDTGYDVKFFGDTASAYMLWDASADDLILGGAAGLSVNSAALVTGVLTTTAQAVFNGGFDGNAKATINTADGLSSDYALVITNGETTAGQNFGLRVRGGSNASDVAFTVETYDNSSDLFRMYGNGQASFHDGTVALPSITNIGDLNTGMYFPAADEIAFTEGGVEAARFDSSGRLLIGTDTARSTSGHTAQLQVEGSGSFSEATLSIVGNENNTNGSYLNFGKSRGTTAGSNTIVQDGDVSGQIQFNAADGTDMTSRVATITAKVDGTPALDDTPGLLDFATTASGASSPTLRMRINARGDVYTAANSTLSANIMNMYGGTITIPGNTTRYVTFNGNLLQIGVAEVTMGFYGSAGSGTGGLKVIDAGHWGGTIYHQATEIYRYSGGLTINAITETALGWKAEVVNGVAQASVGFYMIHANSGTNSQDMTGIVTVETS